MPAPVQTTYDPTSISERPVALPNEPIRRITERLSIQPPLSRRGHGPAVLIFLPAEGDVPPLNEGRKPLDPEPVQKWAEEGFAVAFVRLSEDLDVRQIMGDAAKALIDLDDSLVDTKDKFGVIVYGSDAAASKRIWQAIDEDPRYICAIGYGVATSVPDNGQETSALFHDIKGHSRNLVGSGEIHCYNETASPWFALPYSSSYDPGSAALAHTRSLVFLRQHLGGPHFDLEKIWEEHTYFEFEDRSVAKTMATMVAEPYVNHIPTMTGGVGREDLTKFYRDHFIFSNPADARLQVVSRTVGPDRVVDEFVYHITHDRQVDWLLPGVPATNRSLSIPMLAVVNIRGDRLYNEHIWWDQATALKQAGLLPSHVMLPSPEGQAQQLRLPVAGREAAEMLIDESTGKSNEMLGQGWGVSPVGM